MTIILCAALVMAAYVLTGWTLDELRETREERPGRHRAKEVVL